MALDNEETLRNRIQKLTPRKLDHFPKLAGGEPYRFDQWTCDREGRFCLYYVVTGGQREYKKRLPMQELIKAATLFGERGVFHRTDFRRFCPVVYRDGSCGYAVILRILEHLYDKKISP